MLLQLRPEERQRGVITFSSGNHGIAMSLAAPLTGCPAVVVMPTTAPAVKVEIARGLGAEIIFEGTTTIERKARTEAEAAARGLTIVPPFDHPWIIGGPGHDRPRDPRAGAGHGGGLRADQRRRPARRRRHGHQEPGARRPRRRRRARVHAADDAIARGRPPGHRSRGRGHGRRPAGGPAGRHHVRAHPGVCRRDRRPSTTTPSSTRCDGCSIARGSWPSRAAPRRSPRPWAGATHRGRATARVAARDIAGPAVALISGGNVEAGAFGRYITSARHT